MSESTATKPMRAFWIICGVALAWNVIGIVTYLMTVTMSPETLAGLPEAERALHADTPVWVTAAYAIAVFGGTAGCIALLMRRAAAVPILGVSLVAILIQMGHALLMTEMLEVQGYVSAVLPALIILIAVYLVWFANAARRRGLIS